MAKEEHGHYHPTDTIEQTVKGATAGGIVGFGFSAIQATLTKRNIGAFGVFTRFGRTTAIFAAMCGTFEFAKHASANLRERDDSLNATIGGFLAGSILGLQMRSTPRMLGYGTLVGVALGVYEYGGSALSGPGRDPEMDEFDRKEFMRKNRRGPIEETINNIGEGRGIYGPGYAERRAERIKERYGIDVPRS